MPHSTLEGREESGGEASRRAGSGGRLGSNWQFLSTVPREAGVVGLCLYVSAIPRRNRWLFAALTGGGRPF